jgi:MFS family permease
MQHVLFPDPAHAFWKGLVFATFPVAEITSVGYFGALCDRVGRKKVLVFAHLISAVAVFLFIPSIGPAIGAEVSPYPVTIVFALFGIGAAAKVSSTLTMVNDHASPQNRAQLMAVFDLVTIGGFAGGFGAGFLALTVFHRHPTEVLTFGGLGVMASVIMVFFLVQDTRTTAEAKVGALDLLRVVLKDKDVLRLLPVYVPVIALYGYIISFTDHLLIGGSSEPIQGAPLLAVVLALGIPLVVSMAVTSRFSDKVLLRRPFMLAGLLALGGLAIVIAGASSPEGGSDLMRLYQLWPILATFSAFAGAFPPAALAYLGDIAKRAVSGTTFGLYSIIFGSGLIVGPILGGVLTSTLGSLAFIVTALGLIGISSVAILFLREPLKMAARGEL